MSKTHHHLDNLTPPPHLTTIWDALGQRWEKQNNTQLWTLQDHKYPMQETWPHLIQYFAPLRTKPPQMWETYPNQQAKTFAFVENNTENILLTLRRIISSIDHLYGSNTPSRDKTQDTILETEFWAETRGVLSAAYNTLNVWQNMMEAGNHPDSLNPTPLDTPIYPPDPTPSPVELKIIEGGNQP